LVAPDGMDSPMGVIENTYIVFYLYFYKINDFLYAIETKLPA